MSSSVFLIVVDNPAHRVLLNRYLSSTSHHLVYATDGEDGFDRYAEVRPDLVLIYAHVSRLDGTILCQLIRQQPGGAETPIVLIVDEATNRDESWAQSVGADGMLRLPFGRAALLTCIAPLLMSGRPPRPVEPRHPTPEPQLGDPTEVLGEPLLGFEDNTDARPSPARARAGEPDMDTVVSFQNPFYEGAVSDSALVDPKIGERERSTPGRGSLGVMVADIGENERVTNVRAAPETVTLDVQSTAAPERHPTDRGEDHSPSDGVPIVRPQVVIEDEGSGRSGLQAPMVPNPLAEPRIGSSTGSRPETSKSQLIQEMPLDGTPSSSAGQRISAIRQRAQGKERRGLDASQLGKRLAKRVRKMFDLLDEVDYYQLLGVEPEADLDALQRAYFELSLEFHPDRFFLLRSGDLKEKIYFIYRRIHEAFRILADPTRRNAYNQMLGLREEKRAPEAMRSESDATDSAEAAGGIAVTAASPRAQAFVDKAKAAYALGDFNGARLHLSLAKTYEVGNEQIIAALALVAGQLTPLV